MSTITMIDTRDKQTRRYDANEIDYIRTASAGDLYSEKDIEGNGLAYYESLTVLYFKDGRTATFSSNWIMICR